MPGDEAREETGAVGDIVADAGRQRTGPRHAAPRKPLLTRLHLPAGKAIAMAAMPSAVLMGMGLTPQLASAKPQPKNPFKDGPCVSAPDKEDEARADAAEKAKESAQKQAAEASEKKAERKAEQKEKAEKRKAAQERAEQKEKSEKEKSKEEDSDKADPTPEESGQGGSDSAGGSQDSAEPEPEPSESESKNPLDPLGVGEKLKDLLTPGDKDEEDGDGAEPSPTPEPSDPGNGDSEKPQQPGEDTGGGNGDGQSGEAGQGEGNGDNDEADGSSSDKKKQPDPSPSESDADNAEDEADAGKGEDGKKPFPCVEEKKVDGEDEKTPVTLPNQPWELQASKLGLHGLDYKGVVNVRTADGGSKQALKFTADSVDIGDLHQIVDGPNGTKYHVRAAEGSNSTIRNGQVTMYTERLEGNLFGIIPIVFDPEHPPPLNVPEALFTDVKVKQAGQFGGTLTVPGLQQNITQ